MPIVNNKQLIIALTGGGTAGHVLPHFALLEQYQARKWRYIYLGSNGIEKKLCLERQVAFFEISAGKLRRYFSLQNFLDFFKVLLGFVQSLYGLKKHKVDLVFSKGGFVSVPVCYAAWCLKIPVMTHESDLTPGLATRLIARIADKIFYTFEETSQHLPQSKSEHVGAIIRPELLLGNKENALDFLNWEPSSKPCLLVMGGSLGAKRINDILYLCLPDLLKNYRIIHITGHGKSQPFQHKDYRSYTFLNQELAHVFSLADLVISRAGSNAIFEFLALNKPMLLVPLERGSRGDQVENALFFARKGWAMVLREAELNKQALMSKLNELLLNKDAICQSQLEAASQCRESIDKILTAMNALAEKALMGP